ncbi:MAG: BhlA/UviB family holin-like peptide [Christensenellales bacterium]|jgi:hypothetical protein
MVWDEVVKVAAANGLWATMFVGLLIYQLQDSRKRENKYIETIEKLTDSLSVLEDVREDVKVIKSLANKSGRKSREAVL